MVFKGFRRVRMLPHLSFHNRQIQRKILHRIQVFLDSHIISPMKHIKKNKKQGELKLISYEFIS